jgi:choline dehydrogenase-like flavoprotein
MSRAEDEAVDVVIVGAGASGAVAAARLVDAGLSVTCLEQGDWHDRSEYRGSSWDWELTARKQWASDPNVRHSPGDYFVDTSDSDMKVGMFNGVGGGTVLFNAVWPRLTPADFRVRSQDGVADDWPISYEDLEPYYNQTDRQFGVSGLGGNPIYPGETAPPCPPLPVGPGGILVARAHARLGWHWWPDTNAIISTLYGGRNPCVQRGTCAQGCGEGAKSSVDVTHWPAAVSRGVRLLTAATVVQIVTDRSGLATGVEWADRDGKLRYQAGRVVLLAANGIGTPRLLLASRTNRHPDGLANSSGLVGRRLMLHPYVKVTGWFDQPLQTWQGHNGSAIGCWQFYPSVPERGFIRGSKWSLHPGGGPLAVALPPNSKPVWGPAHHDHVSARFGRSLSWILLCEDLPEETNRIELSEHTDPYGLPLPELHYRISDNTRRMMLWQAQRAAESLRQAGAVGIETVMVPSNSHLLGTTRMGHTPDTSVVDPWGMTHDIPNLGIIDGSVFVTVGAVNPTSTITALALRAADHLVATGPPSRVAPAASPPSKPTSPDRAAPERNVALFRAWSSEERRQFERVADILIPGRGDRPSPTALALGDKRLDLVTTARPDIAESLRRALRLLEATYSGTDDPDALLAGLDDTDGSALLVAVAGAYYTSPQVRRTIGYPGQEALTIYPHTIPDYIEEGLLDHVVS